MKRAPAVADRFYPGSADELNKMLSEMVQESAEKREVLGALLPHAGYVFSGPTAGKVVGTIQVPRRVILLTPSHRYDYPPCALWTGDAWQTPLGDVPVDRDLTAALEALDAVTADEKTHLPEHSGEVVVPFLQHVQPDVQMAFMCVTRSCQYDRLKQLGEGLARIVEQQDDPVLIVTSSDMSHEGGPRAKETVREHDPIAIEDMKQLNAEKLLQDSLRVPITMCGVRPATAMIEAVKALGAAQGELVARATSADSPYGKDDYVVGYAGMIFH